MYGAPMQDEEMVQRDGEIHPHVANTICSIQGHNWYPPPHVERAPNTRTCILKFRVECCHPHTYARVRDTSIKFVVKISRVDRVVNQTFLLTISDAL